MKRLKRIIRVNNELGLHIRPAASIVKMLQKRKSEVSISYNKIDADGRSMIALLTLLAKKGAKITIVVEGDDAQTTLDELTAAFKNNFGE